MKNLYVQRAIRIGAPYAATALAVVAATTVLDASGGILAQRPFVPLFFVSMLITVTAGPGPGVLATVLGALIGDFLFLEPRGSLAIYAKTDAIRLAVFVAPALLFSLGVSLYGRRQRRLVATEIGRTRSLLREEANETLRESEERYRRLFETSRDGIATIDFDGRIADANPAFLSMLGYTLTELRDLCYPDITPERWRETDARILRELILPLGDSGEFEKEYICKDGSVLPVSVRAWPILDAQGKIVAVRAFVRDITERRRAQEALKMADQRKDEFIATLAHELRNPLSPIRNVIYVLRRESALTRQRDKQLLDMAERQVDHLIRLVNELLDFSRISRGKIELKRENVDLRLVLRHAIETAQPAIRSGGHTLRASFPGVPMVVHGDFVRLAQIFTNLLDNAAKYTEHGGTISLVADASRTEIIVTVSDTGVGVPADMLPYIFHYFTQVDRTLGRAKGGLGIGLALVRTLLTLHGGTVEAHSAGVGGGSAFVVKLPAAPAEASGAEEPARIAEKSAPRRVLIIDDEKDVADSFAALLQQLGAVAEAVYCGESGVARVAALRPEIVLLDLGMPGIDGFETARRIRALPEGRKLLLVALSGWGEEQVQARMGPAGFDRRLTKPAEVEALGALLSAHPAAQAAPDG
ncbi:MAG: hybrid sensor histidine kinase/response regulator [Hyphomicrobiales bacterium]|nr:MAG: hybrid sensor histidine kinase/response regulator [Hyphomicrobiales bacterium]